MQPISLKDSIGTKLLKSAFGLYLLVTLTITGIQLITEYLRVKSSMVAEVKNLEKSFKEGVGKALWDYNVNQVQSILAGLNEIDSITGAKITDMDGKVLATTGEFVDDTIGADQFYRVYDKELDINIIEFKTSKFSRKLYEHKFELTSLDSDNETVKVGQGYVYISENAVVNRFKYGFLLILLNSFLKSVALWYIFFITTRRIVTRPLNNFAKLVQQIDTTKPQIDQNHALSSLSARKDEIGYLSNQFNDMLKSIMVNINTITDLNNNLEAKVRERTQALQEKSRDILTMLQNMKQGIFTIIPGGVIHPEYSTYLEEIIESREIAEQNPITLVFKKSNLSQDELDQLQNALAFSLCDTEISFGINEHCFPREITFMGSSGQKKILELDWQGIVSEGEEDPIIDKIMVVVRDVTNVRTLRKQAEQQKIELEIIGQILKLGTETFLAFHTYSEKMLKEANFILNKDVLKNEDMEKLFINMHTVKGSSRTYDLRYLSDAVHVAEQRYSDLRGVKEITKVHIQEMRADLQIISQNLELYHVVYANNLKTSVSEKHIKQDRVIKNCLSIIKSINYSNISDPDLKKVISELDSLHYIDVQDSLSLIVDSIPKLAKDLGKDLPTIHLNMANQVKVDQQTSELLQNVFVHLFRNAIDHGIECAEERLAKSKTQKGTIDINLNENGSTLEIDFFDDGRGLRLAKLQEKLTHKDPKSLNDEEIAQMIFASGISTADKTTDISGRGVGMDAVKKFIEEAGGSIDIRFTGAKDKDGNRPFMFKLKIPKKQAARRNDRVA